MQIETPYPYQLTGADYLAAHPQAFLADDMGLGKSCQAVVASDLIGADRILVLCPGSVRVNWEREFQKFSPMDRPCRVLMTGEDEVPTTGVVICSYDLLVAPTATKAEKRAKKAPEDPALKAKAKAARQLKAKRQAFLRAIQATRWDVLVLDEAQYLKDRGAGRTTAVFGHNVNDLGIAGNAERIWRLSGTPAPNNVSELWIHLRSAGIITMGYYDFVARYCVCVEGKFDVKIVGSKNVDELKGLLSQFMLRRMKADVQQDLPPIRFVEVAVEASPVPMSATEVEEIRVGEQTLSQALAAIAPEAVQGVLDTEGVAMATLRRYTGLAKLPGALKIIQEELESGTLDKIVLFAVHQAVVEGAQKTLANFGAVSVYGKTPGPQRQANIDRFSKDPSCRVIVGNITAAGVGVNGMQDSCSEVGLLESSWVPSDNAQAVARVHRNGQSKSVRVRVFSLHNSSDEPVNAALIRKIRELAKIF
jgi:SWI/SNF-related matrix-associated actin-dependent regulator 1 of chromatin subfamily A